MSLLNLMTSSVLRRGCKEYNSKQTIEKNNNNNTQNFEMLHGKWKTTKGTAILHFRLSKQVYKTKDLIWCFKRLLTTILVYS